MNWSSPISSKEGSVEEGEGNHHWLVEQVDILPYRLLSNSLHWLVLFFPFNISGNRDFGRLNNLPKFINLVIGRDEVTDPDLSQQFLLSYHTTLVTSVGLSVGSEGKEDRERRSSVFQHEGPENWCALN